MSQHHNVPSSRYHYTVMSYSHSYCMAFLKIVASVVKDTSHSFQVGRKSNNHRQHSILAPTFSGKFS